jgi:hypothetical protein
VIDSTSPRNEETLRRLAQLQEELGAAAATLGQGDNRQIRETVLEDVREGLRIAEESITQITADERAAEVVREELFLAKNQIHAANSLGGVSAKEPPEMSYRNLAGEITYRVEELVDGRRLIASPVASQESPHYFPGGQVRGRLVPRGWYSHDWWRDIEVEWRWRKLEEEVLRAAIIGGGVVIGGLAYAFYQHIAAEHGSSRHSLDEWLHGAGGTGNSPSSISQVYEVYVGLVDGVSNTAGDEGAPVDDPSGFDLDTSL